jgi:hypothetical protein
VAVDAVAVEAEFAVGKTITVELKKQKQSSTRITQIRLTIVMRIDTLR